MERLPEIETERLVLKELMAADIPLIVQYAANRNISSYTLNLPFPYAEKDAIYWINMANQGLKSKTHLIFAIRLKNQDAFIGGIGMKIEPHFFRADIGYWLAEPFWNNGYTTEALGAVIRYGFNELKLNKITASHFDKNPASGKVMAKCGMKKEGVLKEHIYKDAVFHDLVLYGLTKSDFADKTVTH